MSDAPVATPVAPLPGETILVTERVVACDGGGIGVPANPLAAGPAVLGHPLVYLRIEHHEVVCPYCSRRFVLKDGDHADGH